MKRLFPIILILLCFALRSEAADATIANAPGGAITTVPNGYVMPWENPAVQGYDITFQNLTNQILFGYASQAFANAAAQTATNGFPWGVLYDPAGAAQGATNGFPWGVLYDPAGRAQAATNGYPWGVLYDPAGAAQGATNGYPWGVLYQPASSALTNLSIGNGGALTNVPFSIWTNYGATPLIYTNLNGLAFSPGFGVLTSWTLTNYPGIGPIGIRVLNVDTNHFLTTDYGGTFTGAVYSVATSQNAPATNQLVDASFVRSLLTGANVPFYNSTNIDSAATNIGSGELVYQYVGAIPPSNSRSYSSAFLTNNGYLGAAITTNTYQQIGGSILVAVCAGWSGGSGTRSITFKVELYVSSDKTNWFGDWSGPTLTLGPDSTNYTPVVVDVPNTVATNAGGYYLERRLKIVGTPTFSGSPTFWVLVGTNSLTGSGDAGHITLPSPTSTAGNAYLAANQTFTGTNTFTQQIITGQGGSLNTSVLGVTVDGAGSAVSSGVKGYLSVPWPCTINSCTLMADVSGSITFNVWRTNSADGSFPPTVAGSIGTNSLTSDNYNVDSTLTGWTTTLATGDVIGFNVPTTATTITRCTLQLKVTR